MIDIELPVAGADAAFEGDRLADDELRRRLGEILDELVAAVRQRRAVRSTDGSPHVLAEAA